MARGRMLVRYQHTLLTTGGEIMAESSILPIRRVVTGNDERGRSKVVWDGPAPNAHSASMGSVKGHTDLWVWKDMPPPLGARIVTGALHFTESEAVLALTESADPPADNSQSIKRISTQMIERYAPKAKQAVQQMREVVRQDLNSKGMFEVLDNAEYYIADAERFLRQAKFELAVLSIGYAEGLIDALRFQKGINPWETRG